MTNSGFPTIGILCFLLLVAQLAFQQTFPISSIARNNTRLVCQSLLCMYCVYVCLTNPLTVFIFINYYDYNIDISAM